MNAKRPYKHILKNLLHEQAAEIIPLLLPGFQVERALDVEMPELKTTPIDGPPGDFDQGIAGLALPGATVTGAYQTEWIEHSGTFERAYLVHNNETDKPCYLVFELQLERDDEDLPLQLLSTYARMLSYTFKDAIEGAEQKDRDEEHDGLVLQVGEQKLSIYPYMICPFPEAVPANIRDEFDGEVNLAFNFLKIKLWEKDAREFLNTHVITTYFLLPAMKNADAPLLRLAIEELAVHFRHDVKELSRHLTGLHMMVQLSDTMPEEEKLATQEHLKRFEHLIKHDPADV
ncbi:MAG: hypothetical protein ACRDIV_26240 [Ktedonobacteraceae bacterium]